jgi:hypothetical protein
MRFALIATTVAAAAAAPLAVSATGPAMSPQQFLSEVRCTAYADIALSDAALAEAKWRLNTEARQQAPETAALARAEINEIARKAVSIQTAADAAMIHRESMAACSGAAMAAGADSPSAV